MAPTPPSDEHTADPAVYRAALRTARLAAREALSPADHAARSARIETHLATLLATRPAGTLAFCAAVRKEFDARPLVTRLLAAGWRAAMPVVLAPAAPMVFRAWSPQTPMATDRHGIPIPAQGLAVSPDVVLLPLVAFDGAGYRIGYGGGYFDRTLAATVPRPWSIGVGFELGRVDSIRPEAHDWPLDALVTEAGASCIRGDSG